MKSTKELNRAIESLLGDAPSYDLRREFRVMESELSYDRARSIYDAIPEEERHLYSITSSSPNNYTEDPALALYAAKRIADKNECTFVLSLETGTWKGAFGNWGDCAEHSGSNPAHVICISVLKFMGRL